MAENALRKGCNVGEMEAGSINFGAEKKEKIHFFPPSTPNFHGREREMTDLVNSVREVQTYEGTFDKMIIISGLGGMGKSEIAKVLAQKVKDQFQYIFWFNAKSRSSLDSSFHQLLTLFNVRLIEQDTTAHQMASKAYKVLEEHFTKTMFIFDDADMLRAETSSSFGLEEYLLPDLDCKKPVIVVTTRNDWRSLKPNLKIIRLDVLGDEEARVCFLKYLRLEGLEIPPSLSTTIDKLVHTVQGFPLGISLMGNEAVQQEDEISFGNVENRISNYLRLLEIQPLEKLTGQEKYEGNLQIIFDERMRKIETTETGIDAAQILSILSLLSLDNIYVGLINGILSRKNFYPQEYICERFLVDDSELRVERALKFLESNSLIRIDSVKIKNWGTFDIIRIDRVVQMCAQNSKSVLFQPTHTLQLIADFFPTNEDNLYFRDHISAILKSMDKTAFPVENSIVLSLLYEFISNGPKNQKLDEVVRMIISRKWNAQEKLVISLIKTLEEDKSKEKRVLWEIKELMLQLPEEFIRRGWILQLCTQVLDTYVDDFDETDRRSLRRWLKKCYVECPSINRYFPKLLTSIYRNNGSVLDSSDGEFVLKVFSSASERKRRYFWHEVFLYIKSLDVFMGFVPYFFPSSGETNLFVKSLDFSTPELKKDFIQLWAHDYSSCVSLVIENEEMREKLLVTENFAHALKSITEFGFNEITREFDHGMAIGILHLLKIWLELFCAHELSFNRFGTFIDRVVLDSLKSTQVSSVWKTSNFLDDFKISFLNLTHLEYCSVATKTWIETLFPGKPVEEGNSFTDLSISEAKKQRLDREAEDQVAGSSKMPPLSLAEGNSPVPYQTPCVTHSEINPIDHSKFQFQYLKRFDPTTHKSNPNTSAANESIKAALATLEQGYPTKAENKGIVLILNTINDKDEHVKTESDKDIRHLTQVLQQRKFLVYHLIGPTERELRAVAKECQTADSFLLAVMSHGNRNKIEIWNGIMEKFNNIICKELQGKPKIFIFHCLGATGSDFAMGPQCGLSGFVSTEGAQKPCKYKTGKDELTLLGNQINPAELISSWTDMILWFATDPTGDVSKRIETEGSVFIQTICEVLRVHREKSPRDTVEIFKLMNIVSEVLKCESEKGAKPICQYYNVGFTKKFHI